MKVRFLIVVLVSLGAFSAPVFGQGAELVYVEVRDIETDSLLHAVIVPDEAVHLIAEGVHYSYNQTAYVIQTDPPNKNNTTKRKLRPGYIIPSLKRV
jgi:hypothetical protein